MNSAIVPPANYSYTISKDGSYTVLSNSGGEISRNLDAVTEINSGILLASGISGSVLISAGSYSLTASIDMKSHATVYVQQGVIFTVTTWSYSSKRGIVDFRGITYASFITETEIGGAIPTPEDEALYPQIIGLGTNDYEYGAYFSSGSTYCTLGQFKFVDVGGYGVQIYGASHNTLDRTYIYGFCHHGGASHQGIDLRNANYNTINQCHVDGKNWIVSGDNGAQHCLYFGGDQGDVAYNTVIGGLYENSGISHAIYWCSDTGNVHHNTAYGGISKNCHGTHPYACGFKCNPANTNRIGIRPDGTIDPWTVIACWTGLEMGDGGNGGNHDNLVYIKIINCDKASEWFTQATGQQVQNNEVHMDIDGNNPNYDKVPSSGGKYSGRWALCFEQGAAQANSLVQHNIIYLKVRNVYTAGVVIIGWNGNLRQEQQPIYNTIYCDIEVTQHPIYWAQDSAGGTYNTFYLQHIVGLTGNCPTIPNAQYVYTDSQSFIPNIATNTFNPS